MSRRPDWLASLTKAHAKAPDPAAEPESLKSKIDNQRSRMLSLQAVISDVAVLRPHQIGQHREHRWGVQNYCGEGFAAG